MKIILVRLNFLLLVSLVSNTVFGQVGINTIDPNQSSALDIQSTTTGVLVPRMTELEKDDIANPAKGLLIFQNDGIEGFWYFTGTEWKPIDTNGEFISDGGVIHNTTSIKTDDFVVGSTSLNNIAGTDDDSRLFFDKGKSAFRAGYNNSTSWDLSNLGSYSAALGYNNEASGNFSVVMGRESVASGTYSVALGRNNTVSGANGTSFGYLNNVTSDYGTAFGRANNVTGNYAIAGGIALTASGLQSVAFGTTNTASGENSFVMGRLNNASGLNSAAIGFTNTASNQGTIALGSLSTASGLNSMALGNNVTAPSYSEVALGIYNTDYTPSSTTATIGTDRIFSIGNGFRQGGVTTRNNAFTILKNGHVGIGTDTPSEALEIHGDDNFSGDADFDAHSYGSNITSFHIRSAAGTQNNPQSVTMKSNANFYNMEAQGYDGNAYSNAAAIRMGSMANSLTGLGDMPGRIDFHTSSDGTVDNQLRMRIDANGNVGIGTTTDALTEKLEVNGKIKATSINFSGLPTHDSDADAGAGGLVTGDLYQTSGGAIRIKQ